MYGNGKAHNQHSEDIVGRLVAAGLPQEADRDNREAIDVAISGLLARVETVPPGRPIPNCYITPQLECGLNTLMMHALIELLVARGAISGKDVEALLIKAQGSGNAAYMPAGLTQLVNHHADVLAWQLKPHGAVVDAKALARRGQR
jgi:hypothetical protein